MSGETELREEWRPVVGYEGLYEVSDQGHVRSLHKDLRILRPWMLHGYENVSLSSEGIKRNKRVNVLVATAWHGQRPPGYVCRHLDGDRRNNRPGNLAWGSPRQNVLDTIRHGRHPCASRDACGAGHPYTVENTGERLRPDGRRKRICLTCERVYRARALEVRRALRDAQ